MYDLEERLEMYFFFCFISCQNYAISQSACSHATTITAVNKLQLDGGARGVLLRVKHIAASEQNATISSLLSAC
jgi:hypothetical protein